MVSFLAWFFGIILSIITLINYVDYVIWKRSQDWK